MVTTEYQVTGMSCEHCERAIAEEVGDLTGVTDTSVSSADGRLVVTSTTPLDDAQVLAAVDEAGYAATRV